MSRQALEQQPVVNPSLDLTPDALAITIPGEAPPVALNFQVCSAWRTASKRCKVVPLALSC